MGTPHSNKTDSHKSGQCAIHMHTPHNDSNNKQLTRVLQKIHIIYKIHDIESERRNVHKERSKVGFLTNHLCNLNC